MGPNPSPQFASHTTPLNKARKTCRSSKREREREKSPPPLFLFRKQKKSIIMRPGQHDVSSRRSLLLVWVVLSRSLMSFFSSPMPTTDCASLFWFDRESNRSRKATLTRRETKALLSLFFCSARRCFFRATSYFFFFPLQSDDDSRRRLCVCDSFSLSL